MEHFGSLLVIAILVVGAGLIVWRKSHRRVQTVTASQHLPSQKELAHYAFTQGNTHLARGEFAEATEAFHHVLELEPKHPHVGGRLAEVTRRQQEAGTEAPVTSAL